ncbi:multiple epidermal growth factor-like domains protein 11 [Anopheles darlingi]|uniref:multiple epidermal growth factor-like domains protein 11 n=1 Tax=Anopheles darlingi TaxID=43151 RepID=UPI0020FFF751|nr:multiple epidermal growth factor-like domains protein 11 [Anopheles darlingi]
MLALLQKGQSAGAGDREQCSDRTEPEWTAKCAAFSYAFFADPNECWKFVFCVLGTPNSYTCPTGQVWSQQHGACMTGNRETCEVFDITNICRGQPDGLQPHPESCTQFVRCTDGVASAESCPTGEVFTGQQCVVGNTNTCEPESDVCRGVAGNDLRPHPNECHLFVFCSPQTGPTVLICPPNEIFRPDIRFCVPGDRATCEYSGVETACVGRPPGVVPHPTSCQLYLSCNGGVSTVMSCPAGSIFNPQTGSCAIGDAETCLVTEGLCTGQPDGLVLEHPFYCSMYLLCQGGQAVILDCPPGEILRVESQFCVPGDIASLYNNICVNQPTGPIPNPATCTCLPGNTVTCELIDGVCANQPDQTVVEHPNICSHFIWCMGGGAQVMPCPDREILRPDAQFCVPGDASSCTFDPVDRTIYRVSTQSCVAGNGDTCEFLDDFCVGRPDAVLPHPEGCALFLMCTSGVTTALQCPEGEILHPEHLVCVAGNAEDCSLSPITTEPPIISVCEGRPDGNYTHPLLCYLFIRCTAGVTEIMTCPPNHIFLGALRDCAPGDQSTCIPF